MVINEDNFKVSIGCIQRFRSIWNIGSNLIHGGVGGVEKNYPVILAYIQKREELSNE